jgi:hypothetical protein
MEKMCRTAVAQSAIERLEAPLFYASIVRKDARRIAVLRVSLWFLFGSHCLKYLQSVQCLVEETLFCE